jgi:hypothetical protein
MSTKSIAFYQQVARQRGDAAALAQAADDVDKLRSAAAKERGPADWPGDWLEPGTPEWDKAWAKLGELELNRIVRERMGSALWCDPKRAEERSTGEVWQYMGTDARGHCFRHRCHPRTMKREYVFVRTNTAETA